VSDLPPGWKPASFGELMAPEPNSLTDGPFGTKLKTAHYVSVGPRVVRLGNIGIGEFLADDEAHIAWNHYETLLKHRVFPGDLLIAGLAHPVGRCCLAPSDIGDAIVKADCFRAKPHPEVTNAYLMHYLNSPQGREALEANSHGLGRLRINLRDLRAVPVPVAPSAEQHRIVATLDGLLARTRCAREELSHIPRLIANYKKAILEAAIPAGLGGARSRRRPAGVEDRQAREHLAAKERACAVGLFSPSNDTPSTIGHGRRLGSVVPQGNLRRVDNGLIEHHPAGNQAQIEAVA